MKKNYSNYYNSISSDYSRTLPGNYHESAITNENERNLEVIIFASLVDETIELKAKLMNVLNDKEKKDIEQSYNKNIEIIQGSFISKDIFNENEEEMLPLLKQIINKKAKQLSEENSLIGIPIKCTIFVNKVSEMIGH